MVITVNGGSDAPRLSELRGISVPEGGTGDVDVLASASNPEGDSLTISALTQGGHGTVVLNDNGNPNDPGDDFITYTTDPEYDGVDNSTFTISYFQGGKNTVPLSVTIVPTTPPGEPPPDKPPLDDGR